MPGNHAGDVAGLIRIGEDVLEVVKTGYAGLVAGAGDEGDVLILTGSLEHIGLVAVRVGEDDVAALFGQVHGSVVAGLVFGHIVLEDHLVGVGGIDAKSFAGSGEAIDMGHVITGVLVVDADQTHFDVSSLTLAGFAALIGRVSDVSSWPPQAVRLRAMASVRSSARIFFFILKSSFTLIHTG